MSETLALSCCGGAVYEGDPESANHRYCMPRRSSWLDWGYYKEKKQLYLRRATASDLSGRKAAKWLQELDDRLDWIKGRSQDMRTVLVSGALVLLITRGPDIIQLWW